MHPKTEAGKASHCAVPEMIHFKQDSGQINNEHLKIPFTWNSHSTEPRFVRTRCSGVHIQSEFLEKEWWYKWTDVVTFRYLDVYGKSQCFDACRFCNKTFLFVECTLAIQQERSETFGVEMDEALFNFWTKPEAFWIPINKDRQTYQEQIFN